MGDQVEPLFTYADIGLPNGRTNGLILLMNQSFIKDQQDDAVAFIGVLEDEANWTNAHPREALQAFADMTKNQAALTQAGPNDFPDGLKMDVPAMQFDIDLSKQFGYAKGEFTAEQ